MNLYPQGHEPFQPRGLPPDEVIEDGLGRIAQGDLARSLGSAAFTLMMARLELEHLRGSLFRAEALIDTQPLPPKYLHYLLPSSINALLETTRATEKCLQEWLESTTCQRILEKYPERPRRRRNAR
jgi:hypothetical protein